MMKKPVLAALLFATPALAQAPVILPPDRPMAIGAVEAVCTGVSLDARENPRWAAYPLKVEIAGRGGQYLGDVAVTLSQDGKILAALRCDGPWTLFRLPPGRYHVEARTEGKTASSDAYAPAQGQGRIILRFPDLGNVVTPPAP